MKNAIRSWRLIACAGFFLLSCKDDETPITTITFETEVQEVTESDGTIESFNPVLSDGETSGRVISTKLVFDRPLAGNAVIRFEIGGTARETATINGDVNDFEIVETGENLTVSGGEITVLKGAREALFNIRIFEDFEFEYYDNALNDAGIPYETIDLTLLSVVSGPMSLGEQPKHTVRILEDDALILLRWNAVDSVNDVDMDLLIYLNDVYETGAQTVDTALKFEGLFIPAGYYDGDYGMSYVYKSGSSDSLDFLVTLINLGGTLTKASGGDPEVISRFPGKYDLSNINAYDVDSENPNTQIVQTMTKQGLNYVNITDITPLDTLSRKATKPLTRNAILKKMMSLKGSSLSKDLKLKSL